MATSFSYGCLLLLVVAQCESPTPGDSCGTPFVSKPGLGIADPSHTLPAMATSLGVFSVGSADECRSKCCSDPSCNLALTEEDAGGARTCYLADCLHHGVNVCELGPAPGMHSYQQEPTLTATQSDHHPLMQPLVTEPKEELAREDYCTPKAETGPCRAAFTRWSYDTGTGTCKKFTFGGCRGNKNNYVSEKDCVDKCSDYNPGPPKLQDGRGGSFEEFCAAPKVTGPCRAAFTRWYYDVTSGACTKFLYGGCSGNENNYLSKEQCEQQCANRTDEHGYYDPPHPFHHSTTAVILAGILAIMLVVLLGAVVAVLVKMARRHERDRDFAAVWSPIDDKECLMNSAYTL